MFGRWSQENYFKYAGEHRDLDALVTQEMDPADGTRLVPNPERAKPKAQLANLRAQLREAHEQHSRQSLGPNRPVARPMVSLLCKCRRSEPTSYGCRPSTARFRPACPGAPPVSRMPCSLVSKSAAFDACVFIVAHRAELCSSCSAPFPRLATRGTCSHTRYPAQQGTFVSRTWSCT
jgi:hypothetical protein